jgi:hypothetical protein
MVYGTTINALYCEISLNSYFLFLYFFVIEKTFSIPSCQSISIHESIIISLCLKYLFLPGTIKNESLDPSYLSLILSVSGGIKNIFLFSHKRYL